MSTLENVLSEINSVELQSEASGLLQRIDSRAKIITVFVFLVCILSLSPFNISTLILYGAFPIVSCSMGNISYYRVAKRSLVVLPFVAFIGIFNPLIDTRTMFYIGGTSISAGWVSFFSIILRGMLSAQVVFILIMSSGFYNTCNALSRLGVPSVLTVQMLFVYRYIFVLIQEAVSMQRARASRGFGKRNYPFRLWGVFIGQLFLRTIRHSEAVRNAMQARGFNGKIHSPTHNSWTARDSVFVVLWCLFFILLRFLKISTLL